MKNVVRIADHRRKSLPTCFSRTELNALLSLYSRRVIRGEWKDYAIDHRPGMAVFSVFKTPHAGPAYAIVKYAGAAAGSPGEFAVWSGRRRLKRGAVLGEVLQVIESEFKLVSP